MCLPNNFNHIYLSDLLVMLMTRKKALLNLIGKLRHERPLLKPKYFLKRLHNYGSQGHLSFFRNWMNLIENDFFKNIRTEIVKLK